MNDEGGKLVPISLEGLEFENDFGQFPIGLGHFSKDQGFIVVASLVGAFVGAAVAGLPLAAIVLVAGLNDIRHASKKNQEDKPASTEQPESPAIDVEAQEVSSLTEATDLTAVGTPYDEFKLPFVCSAPRHPNANRPTKSQVSGDAGMEILQSLAISRRSTLLIGDTGAGKSVTQAYLLTKLFEHHPDADVWVLTQKADSFGGLAEQGRVTLFDPNDPEAALILICCVWAHYDRRRRLPESERPNLSPVRLILADWLSINQSLEDLSADENVKGSRYLSKLADIIYNGRELNVSLLIDLQSYNLAAVGLKADRNSRKNFNLIGLGNYSIDERGMVNDSYGVLTNLISDHYIVADKLERARLIAEFEELHPISKFDKRPILFCGSSPAQLALLPDLREFKNSNFAVTVQVNQKQNLRQHLESIFEKSPGSSVEPAPGADRPPHPAVEPLNQPPGNECTDSVDGSQFSLNDSSQRFTPLNLSKEQALKLVQNLNQELNQTQIIERLWEVKKGGSAAWKEAREQFKRLTGE